MEGTPAEQLKACRQIVADARQAGVAVWSVHIPFGKGWDISVTNSVAQEQALANIRKTMDLCRVLRPRKAVIHASAEPVRDDERVARLKASRQALAQLNPEFAAVGVQLALEVLPRTCLGNTSDEVLWLTGDVQGLGVCLDTNHLLKESLQEFIRKVGARIVTMHAADYDGKNERHWMPGEGINDWKLLVRNLKAVGYQGPLMFETGKHKDGARSRPRSMPRSPGSCSEDRPLLHLWLADHDEAEGLVFPARDIFPSQHPQNDKRPAWPYLCSWRTN